MCIKAPKDLQATSGVNEEIITVVERNSREGEEKRTQFLCRDRSNIYIYMVKGVWIQLLGDQGTRALVILALREYIWNSPAVSLVLTAFDDTGSLGSPLRVVYSPASTMGDCILFPGGK